MPEFVFKPENHEYFLDGARIPSVTEILKAEGFVSPFVENQPIATGFGQHVHLMCWLDLNGTLDESALSAGLSIPLAGWRKWRRDFCFTSIVDVRAKPVAEVSMYHHTMRYGCTPDLVGYGERRRLTIWDIKTTTSKHLSSWELQTAAYVPPVLQFLGLPENTRVDRRVLRLFADKPNYENVILRDPAAWGTFCGALASWKWKERYGRVDGRPD